MAEASAVEPSVELRRYQRRAFLRGKRAAVPVMRDTTERPEGVSAGIALLTGPRTAAITENAARLLTSPTDYRALATAKTPYGEGRATERILEAIRRASFIRAGVRAVC